MTLPRLAKKFGSPIYAYDSETMKKRCRELKTFLPGINLYYACKANPNREIIEMIYEEGFGIETVSAGEIKTAIQTGVPASKITFTCSSISEKELLSVARKKIRIYLDSLIQVENFGKHFPGREISVRVNQGIGAGHHSHVITGGPQSKFGVEILKLPELKRIAGKYNLKIAGLHQHIGSNILEVPILIKAIKTLFKTAFQFPDLKYLDLGGGFGVPYKPGEKKLNLGKLGKETEKMIVEFTKKYGRKIEFSFEPGRYLVAEAGTLLVEVNDIKKNSRRNFIGVNSGFNHLVRPAMYGSYHKIENLTGAGRRRGRFTIAGNLCESGDVFAKDRILPEPRIGDILAIRNAGAYGYAMSSLYNSRPLPKEILFSKNRAREI